MGCGPGTRVTVALPNCPQAVTVFYAINLVGAIANMIHPLSSEKEIEFYLKESGSLFAVTLDQFYHKFEAIRQNVNLDNIILASIKDALSQPIKAGYMLTEGRKLQKIPKDAPIIRWNEFMRRGRSYHWKYRAEKGADDVAVILYSGGTTGITKGILLTSLNFNALGAQVIATNPMFRPGDKMLAVMPVFHGFGLGISIHTMLMNGGCCILVPRFTADSYAKLLLKYRCNFIAGVPTLYEALLRLPKMKNADLSCLKGVFSGGDSLSVELKKRMDRFLFDHHAATQVREGYGLTECVTASCLTPYQQSREGSIGIPFPDTYYKIVEPGSQREVPYGEDGEICLSGPTVMKGYLNHPEETAQTLQTHPDGLTWIHTGDLGVHGRGRLYLLQAAHQAHDRHQRVQRLPLPAGEHLRRPRAGADELRHRGARRTEDAEGEGLRHAQTRGGPPMRRPRRRSWPMPGSTSPSTPCPMISSSAPSCPRPWWARWPTASWRRKNSAGMCRWGRDPEPWGFSFAGFPFVGGAGKPSGLSGPRPDRRGTFSRARESTQRVRIGGGTPYVPPLSCTACFSFRRP